MRYNLGMESSVDSIVSLLHLPPEARIQDGLLHVFNVAVLSEFFTKRLLGRIIGCAGRRLGLLTLFALPQRCIQIVQQLV